MNYKKLLYITIIISMGTYNSTNPCMEKRPLSTQNSNGKDYTDFVFEDDASAADDTDTDDDSDTQENSELEATKNRSENVEEPIDILTHIQLPYSLRAGEIDKLILKSIIEAKESTHFCWERLKQVPKPQLTLYTNEPSSSDYAYMYMNGIPLCYSIQTIFNMHKKYVANIELIKILEEKVQRYAKKYKTSIAQKQPINIYEQIDTGTTLSTTLNEKGAPITPVICTTRFYDREAVENILIEADYTFNR